MHNTLFARISIKFLSILFISSLISSCIGLRDLKLVQPSENLVLNEDGLIPLHNEPYRLKIDDFIKLNIETTDPDAQKIFGTRNTSNAVGGGNNNIQNNFFNNGLRVEQDGSILVYGIGRIYVAGLTLEEAKEKIQVQLDKIYVPGKAYAHLFFEGTRFLILGEVQAPGEKIINRVNVNVFDALAYCGDFTQLANRKEVHLLREYPEGVKRITLDLTKEDIINSQYYFIKPNDIIIVDPRIEKVTGLGGSSTVGDVTQILSLTASTLTFYLFFKSL